MIFRARKSNYPQHGWWYILVPYNFTAPLSWFNPHELRDRLRWLGLK